MFTCRYIVVLWSILLVDKLSSVEIPKKCNMNDSQCKLLVYKSIIKSIASGVPEMKIPAIDPVSLKDITASLPDNVQFTLVEAVGKGLSDCNYDNLKSNFKQRHTVLNVTCDVDIEGQYKIVVPGEVISKIGSTGDGGELKGKGKLRIEKLHMNFDFPFDVVKRDGEIYLQVKYDDGFGLSYKVNDKTVFNSDDFGLDGKLVAFLNEHSKEIEDSIAAVVANRTNEFYHDFCKFFFNSTPVKNLFNEDFSQYF